MPKKSKTNFLNQKKSLTGLQIILFAVAFVTIGAITAWQASAAPRNKGGGGKPVRGASGTISGPILTTDQNSDGIPNQGDKIKFEVTSSGLNAPSVNLKCYVNGSVVAQGLEGYYAGTLDDGIFGLYSSAWTSGAADCVANLVNSTQSYVYATTSFHVEPQGSINSYFTGLL